MYVDVSYFHLVFGFCQCVVPQKWISIRLDPAYAVTKDVLIVFGLVVTGTNPLLGVSTEPNSAMSHPAKISLPDDWAAILQRYDDIFVGYDELTQPAIKRHAMCDRQGDPYGFSSDFRLEDPWAQRRSLDLCLNYAQELCCYVQRMQCLSFSVVEDERRIEGKRK